MPEAIVIIGLPGSGKTYFAQGFTLQNNWPVFDDCATHIKTWEQAKLCFEAGNNAILTDPKFCNSKTLATLKNKLAELNVKARCVYFENDPEQCIQNVKDRNDERVVSPEYIRALSKDYEPEGESMPCYSPSH